MCDFEDNCIPFGLMSPRDQDLMKLMAYKSEYELSYFRGSGWYTFTTKPYKILPEITYRLKKKKEKKRKTFTAYLVRDKVEGKTVLFNRVPIGPHWEVVTTKEVTFEWEE